MKIITGSSTELGFVGLGGNAALLGAEGTAIALAVFVVLTVLLLAFVILLFALPKFRAFFFRDREDRTEKPAEKRPRKKQDRRPSPERTRQGARTAKKPAKKNASSGANIPYIDSVPTVPLGGSTTPTTGDEDIIRRTNDAYVEMTVAAVERSHPTPHTAAAARTTRSNTFDSIPTVVIPSTDSRETSHENGAHIGNSHERITGETHVTHEKPTAAPTPKTTASATQETVKTAATAPATVKTAASAKPVATTPKPATATDTAAVKPTAVKTATTKPATAVKTATATKPTTATKPAASVKPTTATKPTTAKPATTTKPTTAAKPIATTPTAVKTAAVQKPAASKDKAEGVRKK